MGDLLRKLQYLQITKEEIKQSINNKGISLSDDIPFREYPNLINSIKDRELEEKLNKELQGKQSLISVLNMKFGLGLNAQSDWDVIIPKIKGIVVYKLFANAEIKSKMTLDEFNIVSKVKLNKTTMDNKENYKIKSKLELKDFNMEVK